MKKFFNKNLYIAQLIGGLIASFFGQIFLYSYQQQVVSFPLKPYHPNNSFLHNLADNPLTGILLALIGFLLLFYIIFVTAIQLFYHWNHLRWILRSFCIVWIFLLILSTLYNAITLYHILGYLFVFVTTVLTLFLILNYFRYEG